MPLDGVSLRRHRSSVYRGTLRDIADELGIVPVPKTLLLAHKNAELRKHPGSFLFHHQAMAQEFLGGTFVLGLITTSAATFGLFVALVSGSTLGLIMTLAMLFCACLCTASMIAMLSLRVKEPAHWIEAIPETLEGIPAQLVDLAMDIKVNHVGSYFVVGKLIQNKILLDPYLVVQTRQGDEIVIGIWDDEKIVASAKRR